MSGFPLYDNLMKNTLPKKDLTVKQKEEFLKNITGNVNANGKELIYALIQVYFTQNNIKKISTADLPYKGNKEDQGKGFYDITWNLLDLPIPLRHILYNFVSMHINTFKEDVIIT